MSQAGGLVHKDIMPLVRKARKAGWTVERTKGGHIKWASPNGGCFHTAMSPGSPNREKQRVLQRLRRHGLDLR